jgi:hypothetical protein
MTQMDQAEKDRLAQLGLDRRLAEAVGALDLEAATFTRIAGDENAPEADVMQAASNYRAAVQRRNVAYDRACGIPEEEAGQATYVKPAEPGIDEDALNAAVEAELAKRLPELVAGEVAKASASAGGERKPPETGGKGGGS